MENKTIIVSVVQLQAYQDQLVRFLEQDRLKLDNYHLDDEIIKKNELIIKLNAKYEKLTKNNDKANKYRLQNE